MENKTKKKTIVIYHEAIPKVGGIETVTYNLAKGLDKNGWRVILTFKSMKVWESAFFYGQVADIVKLEELENYMKGQVADVCLIASNHQLPEQIKAKRFLQWIHSDYTKYPVKLANKGKVEYIAVTQHCANIIKKLEGINAKVIYNLINEDFGKDKRKVLKLVTNSRISREKGFDRMLLMAKKLKENNIRFIWTVCGDNIYDTKQFDNVKATFSDIEEVSFVGYKKDVTPYLRDADYLVLLSDFEGCPLAVLEALQMEVPCIVTNWGGINELIEDGRNGYILDMQLKNLDKEKIKEIYECKLKFKFEPKSTINDWLKLLGEQNGKS